MKNWVVAASDVIQNHILEPEFQIPILIQNRQDSHEVEFIDNSAVNPNSTVETSCSKNPIGEHPWSYYFSYTAPTRVACCLRKETTVSVALLGVT
jgi:hypothetical protein